MSNPPVRLLGIASALPPHPLPQGTVIEAARSILGPRFAQFERLAPAFQNGGIDERRSVVPLEWFTAAHGWEERTAAFVDGASDLFQEAATRALDAAGLTAAEVDVIVTICSTGIATPTLEARVAGRMGFRNDVIRVPVFGLGCAGGASGLGIARDLAAARPGVTVLLVAVEACTLLFRLDRLTKADIIATALFGDGAAALVLRAVDDDTRPEVGAGYQHMWPDSLNIMGWSVEETGLGVIFDRSIPDFATRELRPALDALVPGHAPDRYVCHPGGAKVLVALEHALNLQDGALDAERRVLARAGNMSAPTVLFVLEEVLAQKQRGDLLVLALGPGFTLSAVPVRVS